MARKYGPPRGPIGKEYRAHLAYCRFVGGYMDWAEYQKRVKTGSKYGPPGAHHTDLEARRHKRWVQRKGWCTWEEYVERSPRYAAELDHDKIAERVAKNREILRQKGLLAA